MDPLIQRVRGWIDTADGWQLPWCRFERPKGPRPGTRPVVLIPGYAMNSFILGYHPNDRSIAEHLAAEGLEVWTIDLRGQGDARRLTGQSNFDMLDLALTDLPKMIEGVLELSATGAQTVDLVGCSLGATFMFMHTAWSTDPRVSRLVNLGGPMRWTGINPLVRGAFRLAPLWSRLPMKGTRKLALRALPIASKLPKLLRIYLHPEITDLSNAAALTQTIDDPIPRVNRQIGRWARHGDLEHDGRNLTADVAQLRLPLLTVLANADGIVPEAAACSAHNAMTGAPRRIVRAGDHRVPMAHADLFISRQAGRQVFEPMANWLLEKQRAP